MTANGSGAVALPYQVYLTLLAHLLCITLSSCTFPGAGDPVDLPGGVAEPAEDGGGVAAVPPTDPLHAPSLGSLHPFP